MIAVGMARFLVWKPFVGRVQSHWICGPFSRSQNDAAGDQEFNPHGAEHRELDQCPNQSHHQ